MKPEIKAQWVQALRSGEYQQGRGRLVRQGYDNSWREYCCLGVLCELAIKEGVVEQDVNPVLGIVGYRAPGSSIVVSTYLPEAVRQWADIDKLDPVVDGQTLSDRNDGTHDHAADFDEIANLIEDHL